MAHVQIVEGDPCGEGLADLFAEKGVKTPVRKAKKWSTHIKGNNKKKKEKSPYQNSANSEF